MDEDLALLKQMAKFLSIIWHRGYAGNFLNNFYKNAVGGVEGAIF